jgi:hypothetical protein
MPNHLPYQNPQGSPIPRPPAPRTESAAPSSQSSQSTQSTQSFADRAEKAVDQVKTSAIERVGDVRSRAQSELTDQRGRIVERVQRVGDMLRGASQQIRHEDEFVSHYLDVASERIGRVASYVGSADPSRLGADVQRFARTRPVWFIGGAFVAGLAIGRFLRSSAPSDFGNSAFGSSELGGGDYPGRYYAGRDHAGHDYAGRDYTRPDFASRDPGSSSDPTPEIF